MPTVEIDENGMIVVHTGESRSLHFNPATHQELREETADGGIIYTVYPREEKAPE